MAQLTYRDAVAAGIAQEMRRDPNVVLLGEDVAAAGGVFKATVGLLDEFGAKRVKDTPISEQAIVGAAMGAAMTGLRPIVDMMFSDFFAVTLGHRRESDREDALHDGRPGHAAARDSLGERRGLALRRAALAERRELVDDDSGPEDRRAGVPRRREGPARRGHPQRRSR